MLSSTQTVSLTSPMSAANLLSRPQVVVHCASSPERRPSHAIIQLNLTHLTVSRRGEPLS